MKSIFAAITPQPDRFPRVGELIRNTNTGNFINLVIEVGLLENKEHEGRGFQNTVKIRSVRYAKTNGGNCLYLNGSRARSFDWFIGGYWEIVEEFKAVKVGNELIDRAEEILAERRKNLQQFRERAANVNPSS